MGTIAIGAIVLLVCAGLIYVSLKLYKALIEGKFENKKPD
jgi:hypothetical protein